MEICQSFYWSKHFECFENISKRGKWEARSAWRLPTPMVFRTAKQILVLEILQRTMWKHIRSILGFTRGLWRFAETKMHRHSVEMKKETSNAEFLRKIWIYWETSTSTSLTHGCDSFRWWQTMNLAYEKNSRNINVV